MGQRCQGLGTYEEPYFLRLFTGFLRKGWRRGREFAAGGWDLLVFLYFFGGKRGPMVLLNGPAGNLHPSPQLSGKDPHEPERSWLV